MQNETVKKTVLVAFGLCFVCSVLVSSAAIGLRDLKKANKVNERKKNILAAAGKLEDGKTIDQLFKQVQTKLFDHVTNDFVDPSGVEGIESLDDYDTKAAARDSKLGEKIGSKEDVAKIKQRVRYSLIYVIGEEDNIEMVVLPVVGKGLWSTLYGFMALENDFNSVAGLTFYEHAETPGLGGEVDNPNWKAKWPGKQVFGDDGSIKLKVVKGQAEEGDQHGVDGLSGATITSNGVSTMIQYWMGDDAYGPLLNKLRETSNRAEGGA